MYNIGDIIRYTGDEWTLSHDNQDGKWLAKSLHEHYAFSNGAWIKSRICLHITENDTFDSKLGYDNALIRKYAYIESIVGYICHANFTEVYIITPHIKSPEEYNNFIKMHPITADSMLPLREYGLYDEKFTTTTIDDVSYGFFCLPNRTYTQDKTKIINVGNRRYNQKEKWGFIPITD